MRIVSTTAQVLASVRTNWMASRKRLGLGLAVRMEPRYGSPPESKLKLVPRFGTFWYMSVECVRGGEFHAARDLGAHRGYGRVGRGRPIDTATACGADPNRR